MDYRLTYTGYPLVLEGYTDASWISNTEDNSSTSGWVFLLGGGAISFVFKKQTCITGSTMESEFVALAAAGNEVEWLKNLLLEIPLCDGVKSLLTPDLTSLKRASDEAWSYMSAVVANINKVVRVDGIQNLPEYWPDGETRNQIGLFTTTLAKNAKNARKYVVHKGFKHIPGTIISSL
uniref:Zinc finger, CCHC-type n=1 Tax=Tanacetum cinerariifolium TaxID=118510 RepID=A0A6L2P894_TANCI|nr:zinc finger, CCHC-type [Tanacetum cinerariifolium]